MYKKIRYVGDIVSESDIIKVNVFTNQKKRCPSLLVQQQFKKVPALTDKEDKSKILQS